MASDSSSTSLGAKIRSHVQYGRSFWEYSQELGVASLLVFAVTETGLTKIGGARQSGIPEMAAMLTTSDTWWAFAHAIGPATFRTLFGACDTEYTIPQLLNSIRLQPLSGTTIKAFNAAYDISKIGFASGRHSLTPGRWVSSHSVLGVPSIPVSSRRPSASGPIPPPPEVSQFFGLGPELCVLEHQTSGVLSIASRDPGRAVHSSSLAN